MMIIVKINLIIHTICNDDNDYYYNDDNNNSNNKKDNNNNNNNNNTYKISQHTDMIMTRIIIE